MNFLIYGFTLLMAAALIGWINSDPGGSRLIKILVITGAWFIIIALFLPWTELRL